MEPDMQPRMLVKHKDLMFILSKGKNYSYINELS